MARCTSVDAATFAREHWSRTPLLSRADTLPAPFTDLLSDADVDELLTARGLREPFFRVVKQGSGVAGTTRSATAGNRRLTDLADAEKVRQAHADGATLVLNSLHRTHPPIVRFCRELAADLGHAVQCNAYVTPGGRAQGFAYHHDTHDVLVLQVSGRKSWRIHPPVTELPLPSQPRAGDDLVGDDDEPLLDVVLEAGDCLYLPRGYVHAASTTDDPSVHLTVGLLSTTWHAVLQDVVKLAEQEPSFRDALPVRPADDDLDLAGFLQRTAAWVAGLPAERLQELVDRRLSAAVPAEPVRMLAQADAVRQLTTTTRVRPRQGLRWTLDEDGDRARLRLPDRVVELPAAAAPALRQVLAGPCTPGDVEALDADGALVLVRRLLREGAVVPA